ncbi:tripartite-type tricarboxylate transporter receptor subunit TctC [Ochrobactrum sp. J50]|jgi:tripartite-type tricarboxylate transporter receptor subunit TctC|uniref:Bug family tripartite tricarboxylate transporter substrate binding protein n=1 Tax=Brucella/Ochrobactrum group TaxID=2826938 RepID=UPI000EFA4F6D|nr:MULTISPECIES: tripartite tricarboxylate transporter substrate binding protein [unclassified Ochrobactrum]NKE73868.1 tripartite tricarboxylate transporter substrate binding protein [Ochrobactrum sp. MC-1LL]TWG96659.1 tripartite-type tricarboxylate transporter receptor subunit TctC [Ochrobactrum sp. J50]WPM81875.1 tripartite tricarboxylate transporter substrate binding protein [Brucella pseudintermedia]
MKKSLRIACLAAGVTIIASSAYAFEPTRPVEFVVTAGPGGGTDIFARTIQSIIGKYNLMSAPIVVTNKGSAGGAEGFVYTAGYKGDPYKLAFGTNNAYLLPVRAKVPYKSDDLIPVSALAADEFILWVNGKSDFKTAAEFVAKAKDDAGMKVGGSQSKDVDQILTSMINDATGSKLGYIPFKSGGEAAVQLAGEHIAANVNNPSENLGQWQAGMVKPLCVFKSEKLKGEGKVAGDMGWSDIPTCKESGIAIENYSMPRTVWLPAGVDQEVVDYYAGILKKVAETPEWAKYLADSSQSAAYMSGNDLSSFIKNDETAVTAVLKREGWLAN